LVIYPEMYQYVLSAKHKINRVVSIRDIHNFDSSLLMRGRDDFIKELKSCRVSKLLRNFPSIMILDCLLPYFHYPSS